MLENIVQMFQSKIWQFGGYIVRGSEKNNYFGRIKYCRFSLITKERKQLERWSVYKKYSP